jgi:F0F1-type ATP synthase membrane subunit b/b'
MSEERLYLEIAIWSQVASATFFIGALVFIWNKWILPVVLAAQERSNAQIAQSQRHRDEAKGALAALREEIDSARRDAELIGQRAEVHGQRERETILKETTEAGERALRDAAGELGRARAAARLRLRDELLERALQIARNDAVRRVTPALDSRLVERFVGSLEEGVGG